MCLCGLSHELVICGRLYVIVELGGLDHEDLAGEHTICKINCGKICESDRYGSRLSDE